MLLSELAKQVDAVLDGDGDIEISACAGMREASSDQVLFWPMPSISPISQALRRPPSSSGNPIPARKA